MFFQTPVGDLADATSAKKDDNVVNCGMRLVSMMQKDVNMCIRNDQTCAKTSADFVTR